MLTFWWKKGGEYKSFVLIACFQTRLNSAGLQRARNLDGKWAHHATSSKKWTESKNWTESKKWTTAFLMQRQSWPDLRAGFFQSLHWTGQFKKGWRIITFAHLPILLSLILCTCSQQNFFHVGLLNKDQIKAIGVWCVKVNDILADKQDWKGNEPRCR